MMPVTWVPWPLPSCGVASLSTKSCPASSWPGEVRVVGLDAGVDHRDHGAGAGAHRVRGVRVDHVQAPLVRPQGVRAAGRGRRQKQHADGQRGRDPCPESHGARLKAGAGRCAVRDNVRSYSGSRPAQPHPRALPRRPAHPRPARGPVALAARPGRALAASRPRCSPRSSAARRARRWPSPRASPTAWTCALSQLLRLDEGGAVSVVRADERRQGGGGGHRYEILTPPLPGQRAEVSRHVLAAGRADRRPRRPADARARQPRDRGRRDRRGGARHRRRAPRLWPPATA